jgi:putative transposase
MGKREAARLFKVSPNTIYEWINRGDDLEPRPAKTRARTLDKAALEQHVRENPDLILRERAAHFKVGINTVWVALQRLGFVKKRATISRARHYEKNDLSAPSRKTDKTLRR